MKTKNNVQKAVLKTIAVLTSLVLLSYNVSAQGFWKELLENTNASLAMVFNSSETEAESSEMLVIAENVYESESEMETWMTNADYFAADASFELESEASMELENWMISENFGLSAIAMNLEADAELELENWMVEDNHFETETVKTNKTEKIVYSTSSFVYSDLEEPELKFEAWMFDSNHFNVKGM